MQRVDPGACLALMALASLTAACSIESGSTWSHAPLSRGDGSATPTAAQSGATTRMPPRVESGTAPAQYVSDVARGFELYQATCSACHGVEGQGGLGPRLNDQAKLFDVISATGEPGDGHLDPIYLDAVLTEGGSYVCGDPDSLMVAYKEPDGWLSSRQVEQLIAWVTASSDIVFEYGSETVSGWRDPDWEPGPDTTPVPDCWQD